MTSQPNSANARDIATVLHPFTNLKTHEEDGPFIIDHGSGIYVTDESGKTYIEGMSGLWCTSLGFSEQRLVDAAANEINHDKRMAMYRKAERLLVEDTGGVFLYHRLQAQLRKPYLKGIEINKYGYSFFSWIGVVHTNIYIGQ